MYNFHCFNTEDRSKCELCNKDGNLLNNNKKAIICPHNNKEKLKLMGEIPSGGLLGLHKERNLKERRKRNHNHFKKEILPTISDSDSKKFHLKRLGYKN